MDFVRNKVSQYKILVQNLKNEGVARKVIRGGGGTAIIRGIRITLGFLISVILARAMGAGEYGKYKYIISWVTLLAMIGRAGVPNLLTREVQIKREKQQPEKLKGLIFWSYGVVIGLSMALGGGYTIVYYSSDMISKSQTLGLLVVPILSIVFIAILAVQQGMIRGAGKVVVAQIGRKLVFPTILLVGALLLGRVIQPKAESVVYLYFLGMVCALGMMTVIQLKLFGNEIKQYTPKLESKVWFKSVVPFMWSSVGGKVNKEIPILLLGSLADPGAVGIFAVARKGANLVQFVLKAINMPLAPIFSRLYARKEIGRLRQVVSTSAKVIFLLTIPVACLFIWFGDYFLSIFGNEFKGGYVALIVLCIGQLVNSSMGSVGLLLNMTEYEKYTAVALSIACSVNLLLGGILVNLYGLLGAAISATLSITAWNFIMTYFSCRKLSINATIFA